MVLPCCRRASSHHQRGRSDRRAERVLSNTSTELSGVRWERGPLPGFSAAVNFRRLLEDRPLFLGEVPDS